MKKSKLTRVITSLLITASVLAFNPIGASAAWRQDSNGWWNTEGNSYSTGWRNIEGKWYYFYPSTGYMASDAWVEGYYVGTDGTMPQSVGFDKMRLFSESLNSSNKHYYNTGSWITNNINYLSIAGNDYLKIYNKSNLLGTNTFGGKDDCTFDLANKYSRFTATVGIDDTTTVINGFLQYYKVKLIIIADGNVLDTKELVYGKDPINVNVNISGYNQLIIRVEKDDQVGSINYDILGGKFYFK